MSIQRAKQSTRLHAKKWNVLFSLATTLSLICNCAPTGASPEPRFTSACGMTYFGPFPDAGISQFSAEELTRAEFVVLDSFYRDNLFGLSFDRMCKSVSGWRLYSSNYAAWIDPEGRGVMGETTCWYSAMEIGSDKFGWNAYPHEMAHLLQNCDPPPQTPNDYETDAQHSNWVRDGIYQAIQNAEIRLQEEFP